MVQEEAMIPAKAPVDRECGGRCESTDCCDADGRLLVVFEVGAMVLVEVLCSELVVDEIDRAVLVVDEINRAVLVRERVFVALDKSGIPVVRNNGVFEEGGEDESMIGSDEFEGSVDRLAV